MSTGIRRLRAVLCDPEGRCCIAGSDGDRQEIEQALASAEAEISALYTSIDANWVQHQRVVAERQRAERAEGQVKELVETLRSVEKALKPWGRPLTDGGRWPVNMLEKTYQQVDAVLAKHKG